MKGAGSGACCWHIMVIIELSVWDQRKRQSPCPQHSRIPYCLVFFPFEPVARRIPALSPFGTGFSPQHISFEMHPHASMGLQFVNFPGCGAYLWMSMLQFYCKANGYWLRRCPRHLWNTPSIRSLTSVPLPNSHLGRRFPLTRHRSTREWAWKGKLLSEATFPSRSLSVLTPFHLLPRPG